MVASKDDSYHRYLTKHGLFAPLMRSFELSLLPPSLGGNLLVSATLELLEMIRLENFKTLVDHICKKHGDLLKEHVSKFKTLDMFFLRHQQNLEYEAFPPDQHSAGGPMHRGGAKMARPARTRSPGKEDSDDDESYFESEEDDAPDAGADADKGAAGASQQPSVGAVQHKEEPVLGGEGPTSTEAKDGQGALKGLLQSYGDDDDDEPAGDAAVVDAPSAEGVVEGAATGIEIEAEATGMAEDPKAAVVGDGAVKSHEATTAIAEEPVTTAPAVAVNGEENGKVVQEEASKSPEGVDATADVDGERAPSAKAKAESRSTLNHVVKRMKVNP